MEVLRFGYRLPFLSAPPLSGAPLPMPSYSPTSIKGAALEEVTLALVAKGAVELAPLPSPGFYSRLFVVWKTSGSWRPVIDLSHLNRFVDVSHFQMETIQSVLLSVRQGDWMASIDLKEAYLQVPIHPSSRHLLRFVFRDRVYQFKALCFGLSTAPQVFTRVMAPVSAILHSMGIRMRRYLDDWLVQSSSRDSLVRDLQTVLSLCHELGIVVNPQKSNLVPSQIVQYLGVVIDSISFRASPSQDRISRLRSTADAFRSSASPPASLWLSLLGALSSLAHLVPGGRLRMRSLQLCLHRSWDRLDLQAPVPVSSVCLQDLQWWLHLPRLSSGVSPDLHFWSDASDVGWGAHLDRQVASGLWDSSQAALSINARELLAVHLGLRQFQSSLRGMTVAVFCDNTTAVAYLRKEGGTRSPLLNSLAQEILRWTESLSIRLAPQFLPGSQNVLADALSRPHQLPHSEWSLNMDVFLSLRRLWPVQIDLFATSDNRRCSIYFSPLHDPMSAGTDAFLQSWDGLQAYAFPPVSLIPRVLAKLRASLGDGAHARGSSLGSAPVVRGSPPAVAGPSCSSAFQARPPAPASISTSLPGSPSAQASCLATLQRFTRAAGFSSAAAVQSSLARRPSSRALYQHRWSVYRSWCRDQGHSVSCPTLAKIADFLYWLRFTKGLSVSSLRGYRSALSAVFRFHLPSLSSDPVFWDLLRSFRLSSAERVMRPPAWDLSKVLQYLVTSAFEPLSHASFRALTLKTLFLLALATAKRVGELQALSSLVTFVGADACLSYIPQFVAKSESLTRSIPRSFLVKSLADFAAGLDTDLLLCPVRALRLYLPRARSLSPGRHRLFVSPRRPSRAMSKNAVSFFLREVISAAGAARPHVGSLRAHDVRSVSTSVAFHRNWSVSSVLESATWASSSVFSSFYLRDIQHEFDGLLSLGPFVAAGTRIG